MIGGQGCHGNVALIVILKGGIIAVLGRFLGFCLRKNTVNVQIFYNIRTKLASRL